MKINTSETTIIQALQDCLGEIPFLQVMNISTAKNGQNPDFRMDVRVQDRSLTVLAKYKISGQPRLARETAFQIKDWLAKGLGEYGIFTAPYISPEAAAICKEAGIGYFDMAGNCFLSFETVFIQREGKPNANIQRRDLRSLYSSKGERI